MALEVKSRTPEAVTVVHDNDGKGRPSCGADTNRGDSVARSGITCPDCLGQRPSEPRPGGGSRATMPGERTKDPLLQPQGIAVESDMRRPWRDVLGELDAHDPVPAGEMPLDPGIRRYVLILLAEGIETFESCEGGPGHAFLEPTVRFYGNAFEGFKAYSIAMTYGLPVRALSREYSVDDGWLTGPHWKMTFLNADPPAGSADVRAVVAEREAAGA
jgi:hypothetical protein